jgi:hypothetical protein
MVASREDRIAYGKKLYEKGVRSIAEMQKAVKAKHGKGIAFRDLTSVFPQKPGGKKKTRGRPPKRGAKKTGRRGRPRAAAASQWLLVTGDEVELHSSIRPLQGRVAELLSEGFSQDDISIYEKTSMDMTIRTTVTL